ncbi:M28 family peptidase [Sphingomonas mali]|uniref:M28 family peptidase n=1 Tax=Sphingomonas mali TaxID=40682 RepID=UPI000A645DAD|nr:M28 family metallopeptidase [Sphingomonas mali]
MRRDMLLLGLAVAGLGSSVGVAARSRHAWAPIDPARLSAITRVLASDAYAGRAPGTPAGERSVDYIIARFKALGLKPAGEKGGWTQKVPLVRNEIGTPSRLAITVGGQVLPLAVGREIAPKTARPGTRVAIDAAPMVFVGYGVAAKERGWDDYKGVDLRGKIAVFLVNDPDFAAEPGEPVAGRFGGRAMTYYGRWSYKYEEAERRGAVGALIIHDTAAAGYGWNVASNLAGGTYDVVRAPGARQALELQSWISADLARTLFSRAGLDLAALERQARSPDFRPVAIGDARFTIDAPERSERIESRNVLARLDGRKYPREALMFAAHWDAFGIGAPDAQGRTIRPGASDDALGVAGVLELARTFAAGPRPERSLIFAAWTAEERGLLGSETYALHPVQPLGTVVANFTLDVLQTAGLARDVVLVGAGQNDLEDDLTRAAASQGRVVTPDSEPQRGLFYRADHFSFAKRGVPTLLLMSLAGGQDLVKGGRAAGNAWVADYTGRCYHQPCDAWSPDWDLRGAASDVALVYRMGLTIANSRRWPHWRPTSEFRGLR